MNIIIIWANDQYVFNLGDIIWFLISVIAFLIFLSCIIGIFSYLVARYSNKLMLKYDSVLVTIGDNGEKLLLTNTSDIEWIKSYLVDMNDSKNVKYIFNYYKDETYKIIGGIDLIPIDHYDEDK